MARAYATDTPSHVHTASHTTGMLDNVRRMSWGAVLAGVAILLVVQLLLALLGVALGLTAVDPAAAAADNPSPTTFSITAGVYWVASSLIATFIGAWAAGRLAGVPDRTFGTLHGIVTWSVATLFLFYVLTSTLGSLAGGAYNMVTGALQSVGQGAQGLAGGVMQVLPDDLRAQADRLFERGQQQAQETGQEAQQATGTTNTADAVRRVVTGVREGASPQDRQAAVNLIAQQAGIPPEEADRRLAEFQNSYRQALTQAQDQARQTAQAAKETVSQAAYWSVGALLLGLLVAAIAGRAGTPDPDRYASY